MLLQVAGALLAFIGAIVTGAGLLSGWRRLLARRTDEERASVVGTAEVVFTAMMGGTGSVTASVTGIEGQQPGDAPITRDQLIAAVASVHREIQSVRSDVHTVRTEAANRSAVTEADVSARVQHELAVRERNERSEALSDLGWALVGIVVTAFGSVLGIVGLFLDWLC